MNTPAVPVVFAFDQRVLRPAAVAIGSLIAAAAPTTRYEIHILHPGFSAGVMDGFRAITAGSPHQMVFHHVDARRFAGLPKGRGSWTEVVYFRFLIPELLATRARAIYSDIDVYFTGDLSSLMELDMRGCPVGAVIGEVNDPAMECHTYFPENPASHVFMSGFLLMDLDRMRSDGLTEQILATARRFGRRLRMFDLEALNLAVSRIVPLPFRYCVLESVYEAAELMEASEARWLARAYTAEELEAARRAPVIVHFAGPLGKPWRRDHVPPYYRRALERVPPALDVTTFRDRRKFLGDKLKAFLRGR